MSRKIPRQVWRGERKGSTNTRSSKAHHHQEKECYRELQQAGEAAGPPSRTRARLKRKVQQQQSPVPHSPIPPTNTNKKPKQARKKLNREHQSNTDDDKLPLSYKAKKSPNTDIHPTSTAGDQPSSAASSSVDQPLPQKYILELILDTLQRRDTYEIFAEPVDPKEVDDYYEIIKEPMDFGTMRAKLHEGLYTTLEQFEHDAFLISGNAMHFNSSTTIFFRQARAIHELSKKVFHLLRTDDQKFVLEYSGTRRRSSRRLQGTEAKNMNYCKSITRHSADARTGSAAVDASSRGEPSSFKGPSIFGNLGAARARDYGGRDSRRCSSSDEADRRCTYRPKSLHDNYSFISGSFTNSKTLVPVNQPDISYRESLMRFVKDLGPTAKMIANRKLQGIYGDCTSQPAQTPALLPFLHTKPSTQDIIIPFHKSFVFDMSLTTTTPDVPKPTGNVIDLSKANADGEESNVQSKIFSSCSRGGSTKLMEDCRRDQQGRGVIVGSEETPAASWLSKSNWNSSSFISPSIGSWKHMHSTETPSTGETAVMMKSSNGGSAKENSRFMEAEAESSTTFAFDLPFLKSRLRQMKTFTDEKRVVWERKGGGHEVKGGGFEEKMKSGKCHNNPPHPDTDLALQL